MVLLLQPDVTGYVKWCHSDFCGTGTRLGLDRDLSRDAAGFCLLNRSLRKVPMVMIMIAIMRCISCTIQRAGAGTDSSVRPAPLRICAVLDSRGGLDMMGDLDGWRKCFAEKSLVIVRVGRRR